MNEKLFMFIRCLKIPPKNTRYDHVYAPSTHKKNNLGS